MQLLEKHKINKFRTSRKKSDFKFKFLVIGCLFMCYSTFENSVSLGKSENVEKSPTGRVLLFQEGGEEEEEAGGEVNCIRSSVNEFPRDLFTIEQRRKGAIVLHFIFACYLFTLLAFVCDDYFVPSIKTLCARLHLSEDVAGATFMAAATSSPELFVNIVGTFVTKGDIGIGTIVGSAVFNILAVPAFCGLFGGQTVKIDWWPLTRDCVAYAVTVILLIFSLLDGVIDWYEALILVVLYVFYIIAMYYNDSVSRLVKNSLRKRKPYKEVTVIQHEGTPLLQDSNGKQRLDLKLQIDKEENGQVVPLVCEEETNAEALQNIPKGFWSKIFFFISWPIAAILFLTIPDCKEESKKKFWPITFLMCIVWIASTSYLVSWMITIMGNTLSIPDSVMGLTFLAAGMSVPEATSSIIVTNQGLGAMGISSSIGSNTFDILLCLGFPWLIKSTFLPSEPGKHIVKINSQGLGYSAMSLLTTLGLLYAAFAINNFTVDRKIGFICLFLYISFTILASLIELNIFFTVNLPTCKS